MTASSEPCSSILPRGRTPCAPIPVRAGTVTAVARLSVVHSGGLIEPSSPVPLYFQIANVVQARIFAGTLQVGARIGTEKELAKEFGVSRITVRKALEVLR